MKLFDPPCRNTEICPPWKSCLECEWRVCVSSTDALVSISSCELTDKRIYWSTVISICDLWANWQTHILKYVMLFHLVSKLTNAYTEVCNAVSSCELTDKCILMYVMLFQFVTCEQTDKRIGYTEVCNVISSCEQTDKRIHWCNVVSSCDLWANWQTHTSVKHVMLLQSSYVLCCSDDYIKIIYV